MSSALGEFEQLVMLAVLRLGPDAYGATIRREIEARTTRELSISAVYSATYEAIPAPIERDGQQFCSQACANAMSESATTTGSLCTCGHASCG